MKLGREDRIIIYNQLQVSKYVKAGVQPIELVWENEKLGYIFKKEQTRELYKKWLRRELD